MLNFKKLTRAQKRQSARPIWKQYCRKNHYLRGHKGVTLSMIVGMIESGKLSA